MIKVWFNHWFSTSYRLIELMKEDAVRQIYVVGSNRQRESVIQKVCDEWYEEPTLTVRRILIFAWNSASGMA